MSGLTGLFDSGVGGLAVLSRIHDRLPLADTAYIADQAHGPYGDQPPDFVLSRARALTLPLTEMGAQVIVLACNTATATAIDPLRRGFRHVEFVGMEPAVKPAAEMTSSGVIGVLATAGTPSAERYQALAAAHSEDIAIIHRIGHGLATAVEEGEEGSLTTKEKLKEHAQAFSAAGADVVVLGCTHYSFLADELEKLSHGSFSVLDLADAVTRQVERIRADSRSGDGTTTHTYYSTDVKHDAERFMSLLGSDVSVEVLWGLGQV